MKVVQIGKSFPPPFGGIETVIASLVQGFSGHPTTRMEVFAAHCQRGLASSQRTYLGTTIHEVPNLGTLARTPIAPSLLREAEKAQPDLLHFHFPYPWAEFLQTLPGRHTPHLVSYHGDIGRFQLIYSLYKPIMQRFLKSAGAIVVATSNHITSSPVLSGPLEAKCRIIPFGMDLNPYRTTPALEETARNLRAELSPDRPLLLFVGRLVTYKGVSTLLRAMPHVDATLAIIGTGPLQTQLGFEAEALGVQEKLRWLGNVSVESLASYYHAADLFVLPSDLPAEAFGLVQVEAHASGLPVVCCDLPTGVTKVNLHEETGLVVPMRNPAAMAEAINALLANDDKRRNLGQKAKERAYREFTIEIMCERYQKVYQDLTSRA